MECDAVRQRLQAYLDDGLPSAVRVTLAEHLSVCRRCAAELKAARTVIRELSKETEIDVPEALWPSIEQRLARVPRSWSPERKRRRWTRMPWRRPLAAAGLLLAVGAGLLGWVVLGNGTEAAQASTINFAIILDDLSFDAREAFGRFLAMYHGRVVPVEAAKQHGRDLNFDLPPSLPHGFSLDRVHALSFGASPGVAAEYSRDDGEFLGVVFHPPVQAEDHGTHKDYPALIGKHRGRRVQVGKWSLVHLTDPTTCHCVLSRLDAASEIAAVMAAVAPE